MMLPSFHVHSTFCDGKSTPEELVLQAIDEGCSELGFSSHAHMPHETAWGMTPCEEKNYKKEILRLKDKYSGKLTIYLGIEYDITSDTDTADYDYIIGSVHYVEKHGVMVPLDETSEWHKKAIVELFDGKPENLAKEYYKTLERIYEKTGCDIVGHFDIITKFNDNEPIYSESEEYKHYALEALKKIVSENIVFEVNTGAMSRGYRMTPYPADFILSAMKEYGAITLITSDCHEKANLTYKMQEIADKLESMGIEYCKCMQDIINFSRKNKIFSKNILTN